MTCAFFGRPFSPIHRCPATIPLPWAFTRNSRDIPLDDPSRPLPAPSRLSQLYTAQSRPPVRRYGRRLRRLSFHGLEAVPPPHLSALNYPVPPFPPPSFCLQTLIRVKDPAIRPLAFESLPTVSRSASFATPPSPFLLLDTGPQVHIP